mgnify:CR=1 FL=1
MRILREIAIIVCSLAISIVAGFFLYTFIEGIRLDLYCREFREGLDCYQEGWDVFPVWLFSFVGGLIAALSIILVSVFCPATRAQSSKKTLWIGATLALPLSFMIGGPLVFLVTVLTGWVALLVVLRFTRRSIKDSLPQ